jgi:replicative DNA helicase
MIHADVDAERALIGCILGGDQELIADAAGVLGPADFTDATCKAVWTAVAALEAAHAVVDFVTVASAMQESGALKGIGGSAALTDLAGNAPSFLRGAAYLKTVVDLGVKRRLAEAGQRIAAVDGDVDAAVAQAEALLRDATAGRQAGSVVWLKDALDRYLADFDARQQQDTDAAAIPTGFTDLDRVLGGGMRAGELIVLAARPRVGKTAWALNVGRNVARSRAVLVASLEMSVLALAERLLSAEARVDHQALRRGFVDGPAWGRIEEAFGRLSEMRLAVDETPAATLAHLRSAARAVGRTAPLALLIVDYIQLVRCPEIRDRYQAIGEVSRGLKALARELGIPVLALSQLSREVEKRDDKRPMLSDLAESGSIERDADIVLFLHREELVNPNTDRRNIADLIVAKQRSGPEAAIPMRFAGEFVSFADLEVYRTPDYQGQETF